MIDGVKVTDLKLLPNQFGRLMEVQRADEPGFPGFGQAYITETFPNIIKAWYRHTSQTDQMCVVSGMIRLGLFDNRRDSPTRGHVTEIMMGDLKPCLVLIPPGVWHGFQAMGEQSAFLLHLNLTPYDFDNPDEERLAADDPTIPFEW